MTKYDNSSTAGTGRERGRDEDNKRQGGSRCPGTLFLYSFYILLLTFIFCCTCESLLPTLMTMWHRQHQQMTMAAAQNTTTSRDNSVTTWDDDVAPAADDDGAAAHDRAAVLDDDGWSLVIAPPLLASSAVGVFFFHSTTYSLAHSLRGWGLTLYIVSITQKYYPFLIERI